jgi:hypothetical protein
MSQEDEDGVNEVFGDIDEDAGQQEGQEEEQEQQEAADEPADDDMAEDAEAVQPNDSSQGIVQALLYPVVQQFTPIEEAWENADEHEKQLAVAILYRKALISEFQVKQRSETEMVAELSLLQRFLPFDNFIYPTERSDWLVQGPRSGDKLVLDASKSSNSDGSPCTWHTAKSMKMFPREIILGYYSALAALSSAPKAGAKKARSEWTTEQYCAAQGAITRLNTWVCLGSGPLLSNDTFVAFPGYCTSETEPIDIKKLDLDPLPFTTLEDMKNAAVLYCRVTPQDDEDEEPGQRAKLHQYGGEKDFVPRFAIPHRVKGTIEYLSAFLESEKELLVKSERDYSAQITEIERRIETLAGFGREEEIFFYAYQLLDEESAITNNVFDMVINKPGTKQGTTPEERYSQNSLKKLVQDKNQMQFTIAWKSTVQNGAQPLTFYAKIVVPMVPHRVYAHLLRTHADLLVKPSQRKQTTDAISADNTQDIILQTAALNSALSKPRKPAAPTAPVAGAPAPKKIIAAAKPSPVKAAAKKHERTEDAGEDADEDDTDEEEDDAHGVFWNGLAKEQAAEAVKQPEQKLSVVQATFARAINSTTVIQPSKGAARTATVTKTPPVASPKPVAATATAPKKEVATKTATTTTTVASTSATNEQKVAPVATAPMAPTPTSIKTTKAVAPVAVATTTKAAAPTPVLFTPIPPALHNVPLAGKRTPQQQLVFETACRIAAGLNDPSMDEASRFQFWSDVKSTDVAALKSESVSGEPIETAVDLVYQAVGMMNMIGYPQLLPELLRREQAAAAEAAAAAQSKGTKDQDAASKQTKPPRVRIEL